MMRPTMVRGNLSWLMSAVFMSVPSISSIELVVCPGLLMPPVPVLCLVFCSTFEPCFPVGFEAVSFVSPFGWWAGCAWLVHVLTHASIISEIGGLSRGMFRV